MSVETPRFGSRERELFLRTLIATDNVSAAARAAGISLTCARQHIAMDKDFAAAVEAARAEAADTLECAIRNRALLGVPRPLWFKGSPTIDPKTGEQAVEWVFDSSREALMLKAAKPEKYRERTESKISASMTVTDMDDATLIERARQIVEDAALRGEGEQPDGVRAIEFRELPAEPTADDLV